MPLPDGTWQAAVGGLVLGTAATTMLASTGEKNSVGKRRCVSVQF